MYKTLTAVMLFALLSACTWVKPTPEGARVQVASPDGVRQCTELGKITVSLKHKIGRIERNLEKVAVELQTLSRNEAAVMGGNTVVPQSRIAEGRQVFGVYDCSTG